MSRDLKKAIKLASKRIPVLGDKRLNHNLSFFCGDMAEAYRQGVFEAQNEIVGRLRAELGKSEGVLK